MTSPGPGPDCIIVGYNDVDFHESVRSSYAMRARSGAYDTVRTNSVQWSGQRIGYMDLLNQTLTKITGQNPRLHVARMPNLGAWYLRSYLHKGGYSAEVINLFNHDQDRLAALLDCRPRALVITTTYYVDPKPIKEIIQYVRARNSSVRIVVGGPFIYNAFDYFKDAADVLFRLLSDIGADIYVVDSQGELTLIRVLSFLRGDALANEVATEPSKGHQKSNSLPVVADGRPERVRTDQLGHIPNLAFFDGNRLVRTPRVPESNDMNVFCEEWADVPEVNFVPTVTMRTARSCAFSCSFCRYPVLAGPLNLKSLEVIERQFDLFQQSGVKQVVVIDDTFNVPLPRFKEICRLLVRKKYDFEWFGYFRAANADDTCFDLMAESRCGGVFLGIESGDQTILNNMNKSARVDKYVRAIREMNKRNVITFASLIVGFPGETASTVQNTIDFIEESQPAYYRAELYYHGVNAPIAERAKEFNLVGAGYSWRHNTMTWQEARDEVSRIYRSVTRSVIMPLHNFDFWCIPYLLGQGISKQQFRSFVSTASQMLLDELREGEAVPATEYARRLASAFA